MQCKISSTKYTTHNKERTILSDDHDSARLKLFNLESDNWHNLLHKNTHSANEFYFILKWSDGTNLYTVEPHAATVTPWTNTWRWKQIPFLKCCGFMVHKSSRVDKNQKHNLKIQFKLYGQHSVLINVLLFLSNTWTMKSICFPKHYWAWKFLHSVNKTCHTAQHTGCLHAGWPEFNSKQV
jgi:hypothetical protein